jgi:hypothetical protein
MQQAEGRRLRTPPPTVHEFLHLGELSANGSLANLFSVRIVEILQTLAPFA